MSETPSDLQQFSEALRAAVFWLKLHDTLITVNPLSSPPGGGGLIYFKPICGGLNRDEGLFEKEGALINLEKMTVSVLHKELEYKVEKLKYKKVGGHAAEDQNQIQTSSW